MKHIIKKIILFQSLLAITLLNAQSYKVEEFGSSKRAKNNQSKFIDTPVSSIVNSNSLRNYLPEFGIYNKEVENVIVPKNISELKNIKEIFSFNYYQDNKIISTLLATKTTGAVYNHSSVIFDRLNNNSLEDISTILVQEHQIIKTKIKRASGTIDYNLSFSIKKGVNKNELFSFWDIDQYVTGNYHNFQIWGTSFPQILNIANSIIKKHTLEKVLVSKIQTSVLPKVFVKSGVYANGILKLNIINRTNESEINFVGNVAETEVSKHNNIANSYALSGNYKEVLSIETGVLFDIGFSLQVNKTDTKDVLYIAEGPWGLDYLEAYATVNNFDINTAKIQYLDDVYEVDRNAKASGEVKGNINLFRHLLPEDKSLNVENYSFINFKITNNEPIEIVIMQDENRVWKNRIRYTILPNLEEKEYNISFNDFIDANGNSVEINNIKTVVFSIIGDYINYKPFSLNINELSFRKKEILAEDNFTFLEKRKLINYPNPFKNSTTIQLPINSKYVQIQVYNLMGNIVDVQKIVTSSSSSKKVTYNAPQLKKGLYKYRLMDDTNNQYSGTFIIKY
jgi:hypothetical protein